MMKSNHSPEPWHVSVNFDPERRKDYAIDTVAPRPDFVAEGLTEDNAIRIVACVNACTGMDDPEHEVDVLRKKAVEHDKTKILVNEFLKNPERFLDLLKKTSTEWQEDNVSRLAAALAYYTIFS